MSRKKTHKSFLKKLAQLPLILLLLASGSSMVLAQGTQENASPENTQQGATLSYEEAQQKRMQGAENIVFSGDRSTTDIIKSYPFLKGSLNGVNAVRIAESKGAGGNLLFVYNKGPLVLDSNACVLPPNVCALDVYADAGTGYKKALDWKHIGSAIHVSRADGQVELFIEESGKQNEFVLQGNSSTGRLLFGMKLPPHPRDCCGPALLKGLNGAPQRPQVQPTPTISYGSAGISLGMSPEQVEQHLAQAARHTKPVSEDKNYVLVYPNGGNGGPDDFEGAMAFGNGHVIYVDYEMPVVNSADELAQEITGAVDSLETKTCTISNYATHGTGGAFSESIFECGPKTFVITVQTLGNSTRMVHVNIGMGQLVAK